MPKLVGVYRAGNGSWYFKATLGRDPLTGKRIRVTKVGFATATGAAKTRREVLAAADSGAVTGTCWPRAAKSATSMRTIDLDDGLVRVLRRRQQVQRCEARSAGYEPRSLRIRGPGRGHRPAGQGLDRARHP
jgi:hypothetical protein